MRIILGTVAIIGAALTALTAGSGIAAAAEPVGQPDRIGLRLNHAETAGLADGPLPALVAMVVPVNRMGAGLEPDTQIYRDDSGGVHASLRQIFLEAAAHPDGSVTVFLNAPGSRDGRILDFYQNWR
ncbi:hypothetical protein D5S18_09620 [Nocardia panacis]|uniref:Uncharacterized protein n=1 Tax=Nocardia panacis TaxID=2340916 RepID=A0A3A4JYX2_9NOCA|nr:hypothetical protein [Nocardia panacis]RJO76545.1 hypothetical protein D5S18_09620 [Nocardia panacis]